MIQLGKHSSMKQVVYIHKDMPNGYINAGAVPLSELGVQVTNEQEVRLACTTPTAVQPELPATATV